MRKSQAVCAFVKAMGSAQILRCLRQGKQMMVNDEVDIVRKRDLGGEKDLREE